MNVLNVNGTSQNACKCGSWLDHWKKFSGQVIPSFCAEKTCTKPPAVGAHIQKDGSTDKGWYIVPLCNDHNRRSQSLELVDSAILVSANVSQTCGGW